VSLNLAHPVDHSATTFVFGLLSRVLSHVRHCQHSLHRQILHARRFSCCAPTVWNSFPSFVRTADSFTSFRSQLKTCYVRKTFVAGPLSAPLIPLYQVFRAL